jgi:hypothetical protein
MPSGHPAEFTLANSVQPRATNDALIAAQKVRKIHMNEYGRTN